MNTVADDNDSPELNHRRIWQVVSQIPEGKVASYGQVAELAGLPRAARLVGNVLKKLPPDTKLPWHRVINSQGKISFPYNSPGYKRQKALLESEGITLLNDKVVMKYYRWQL